MFDDTPREQLAGRVVARFAQMGLPTLACAKLSEEAVAAFYDGDHSNPHFNLVSAEATQIMLEVMPPFSKQLKTAFENIRYTLNTVADVAEQIAPYADMINHARREAGPRFDASGLPLNEGPFTPAELPPAVDATPPVTRAFLTGPSQIEVPAEVLSQFEMTVSGSVQAMHPSDTITGRPHHYVVNGDHSEECPCGGVHALTCEIYDIPYWQHKPTLCSTTRTLCNHTPKHTYGQPCGDYHERIV